MSDPWDYQTTTDDGSREFLVNVELYISNTAASVLRKPIPYRKKEKQPGTDDVKLREKPSTNWIPLQKNLNAAGHWRAATCRLLQEGERCLLNVYIDESQLYQTVYIHLLNQTDIRHADNSLFYRKDCVGIFCTGGQRWTTSHTSEPLYLQFPNSESCLTWQALLKSYAIPEIYGRWFFPEDGGSYRMWRQVELTVLQGRSLGIIKQDDNDPLDDIDDVLETDGPEAEISCEIHLNDIICSRTTTKSGSGSLDWHESFTFSGLPPFENLDIVVWRERKATRPTVLGIIRVALNTFRRGEAVEGWYPVLQTASVGTEIQLGELRLKIKVDEEIILPYANYTKLMTVCKSRSFLDWMSDLENRLKLKTVSTHLLSIAVATNTVVEQVQEYASREVGSESSSSLHTLFRGNTTLTKAIELCMTWYGKAFLEASIGTVLRRLCMEKVAIEVDPMRSGKGSKDVEKNVEVLLYWCHEFWNAIYAVRNECPHEMRMLFKTIRELVEQRSRAEPSGLEANKQLRWQSVSAFCFLRFIVPAILHPHLFGLYPGLPPLPVQRSLTLVAKVIQSLANLNSNVQKEAFMRGVEDFLKDSLPAMTDYISVVSTPLADILPPQSEDAMDRHEKINIVNTLRQRTRKMTVLDRESVPILPHLLDIPRHLAIITSAVIRSSKELSTRSRTGDSVDAAIDNFCRTCFEVEEEALTRVSHLAQQLASTSRRTSEPDEPTDDSASEQLSQRMGRTTLVEVTGSVTAGGQPSLLQKKSRPATAPSPSGSSSPGRPQAFFPDLPNSDEKRARKGQNRPIHLKAPSTDSFPSAGGRIQPISTHLSNEDSTDLLDENGKRKKGRFRGMLRI
ncbi:hypothetical protein D9613_001809 [Agrocybe pediades]|uniref:Rho GTPase activation protein n=1 Tax=Agrocybe pediades TaxID=84607 RepID=A0A8H4VVN4_9AGAR|nr:hypothetical protein D9613_001809 [Agrocybe pediades]KAF9568387.1 Rho GTPase activation protein [Agrocybe pediades]